MNPPEITEYIKSTLVTVVEQLIERGVPAKIDTKAHGVVIDDDYLMFEACVEVTPRWAPKTLDRVKWLFRNRYLSTGLMISKIIRGETDNLVTQLVNFTIERREKILEATSYADSINYTDGKIDSQGLL